MKSIIGRSVICALGLSLASCGSTGPEGTDNRFGNAEAPPNVLIRDLDVYRLVGNEEYVKIPISDDLSEDESQKFFTASADNLNFDVASYYRNGAIYYRITASIRRDSEGELAYADASAVESAVNKTTSLFFRLGFLAEINGREVTMPITGITINPLSYTRLQGGRSSAGKEQIILEYVGVISDIPPSMFRRMDSLDVTWVEAEQAADLTPTPSNEVPAADVAVPVEAYYEPDFEVEAAEVPAMPPGKF